MKEKTVKLSMFTAACLLAGAAVAATGSSNEFRVDIRTGDRVSAGTEELTFSNLWDGDAEATVTIAQDGAAIFTGLTGEGVKTWTVDRNGRYVLTHTTYTNGIAGKVETAVFVVEGKEVPVGELTIDWGQASFVYDGQPKEPVITVKDRETTLTKGTHYFVEYKDNVNVGTAKAIVKGIEPYVGEMTNAFTITAAPIGPGGGEEPGSGVIPEGGISKFDATYVYDGEGHTINTQALYAVTLTGATPSFSFSLDGETGWQNDPFVYTNVGEYVMWYKITAPNYEDYMHQAKVTIKMSAGVVWYVDDANGNDANDGFSWAKAKKTVQAAIDSAVSGNKIFVNDGIDAPIKDNCITIADGDYASPDIPPKRLSVMSVNGPEYTIIDGGRSGRCVEALKQVVHGNGTSHFSVEYFVHKELALYGFSIINGRVKNDPAGTAYGYSGAGALGGSFSNCVFKFNEAHYKGASTVGSGGAAANADLIGCVVVSNGAASSGGGVSSCNVWNSLLEDNGPCPSATSASGGYCAEDGGGAFASILSNCLIRSNHASDGSAVQGCSVYNCVISNHLNGTGSVVYSSKLYDCLIAYNGSDVASASPLELIDEKCELHRCTVAENVADTLIWRGTVCDSIVFDNQCEKIFYFGDQYRTCVTDPSFVDSEHGDFHLLPSSDCIDAGGSCDAQYDLDGNPRIVGKTCDLGCYEFSSTTVIAYASAYEGKFDGSGHSINVVVEYPKSGYSVSYALSESGPWSGTKPEFTNVCDEVVWYSVSASGYLAVTNHESVSITKAAFPGCGEEPGSGSVPEGGVSKFDMVAMYDGEGHTIMTNELIAAFKAAVGGDVAVRYGVTDGEGAVVTQWAEVAPDFTNVCETSVWYKVTSANYQDFVHEAKVTVTNRPVTLTSGTKTDFPYDGKPHAFTNLTVTAGSFVAGEGIATSNWATVTTVVEGVVPNSFDYAPLEGTLLSNYDLSVVTGKIAVVPPDAVVVTVTGHVASVTYDGTKKSVSGYDVVSISDPLYTAADFTFTGQSATNGTNAGTYPMGLKASDFANTNPNFASVVFNVTDGNLVIAQAANAWTVEPAIEGWTYGETAKTPVGAAKFGEVSFAYSPMPVGAAGDYVMTATVAGTANYTGLSKTVDFTIAKGSLPPSDDPDPTDPSVDPDDPGQKENPTIPFSAFDYVGMYDGVAHTIDTNALKQAYVAKIGAVTVGYSAASNGTYQAMAFAFKDVGVTSFWYKVTSANYADIVKPCKVVVTNRPVTLTSGTRTDFTYDGKPHAFTNLTVTAGSVVAGEGIATSNWATVTRVDEGEVENTFDYAAQEGTDLANYEVSVVTGKIAVVAATIPVGPGGVVTAVGYTNVYDGAAHGVAVSASGLLTAPMVQYRADEADVWADVSPAFGDVCDTQVWYRVSAPNYAPVVGSVGVRITPRPVSLTSKSDTKVYDGTPLTAHEVAVGGDGFADGEGAVVTYSGSQTTVGVSENTFTYTFNDGTKAGNYDITTVNGTLTVTKASIGGGEGGGGEPGEGDVPDGGLSKFDATAMYDGEGHTVKTNELVAAFSEAMIGESAVKYAADDGSAGIGGRGAPALPWLVEAPVYTNAGEYVVWYRVTNPNYEDFVHAAKLSITKRPVTISVVGHTATFAYDTTEKTVSGYDVATEDGLYDIAANTVFSGAALASRTDVGTTAMGLSAANFANKNENFEVTYRVTDGWLKIEPRIIGDDPANWDIRLDRAEMYDGTEKSAPIIQVAFVKPDGNLDYIPYTLEGNTATDAGNYKLRITGAGNYSGTVEKDWAITPRNVTLTSGGAEWVYDGEVHSQSAVSVTGDGFAAGEGASYSGFPVVRHVADAAEAMANTFAYAFNANTKAQNYEVTTRFGTVKMTPRAVTLTAPTKSKPYDGTPLTFGAGEVEAVATGATLPGGGQGLPALPEGEAFTLGNFASITEAGRVDATFTVADGTARMADYALTIVPGTLTVTRNATQITVTAKSGSWTYDGQPHTLHEYEATNLGTLIAGDALEVTFDEASVVTTPLDGPEGNGVVANVITGVRVMRGDIDVSVNYTLAPYNGTLTVTKRPVTLKSKSASKTYDGEPLTAHEVEIGGDGFVGEDGAAFTFTGSQTVVGKSRNTFAYALNGGTNAAFYDITKMEGDLEVTAADISAGDDSDWQIVMGPSLTYTGLEQIQTLSSVTYKGLPLDYAVVGNAQTDAGNYTMTLTGQGNFTGMHQVAWSIAPKSLTLTAGSGNRMYDGTAFTVGTVTAVGFAPGEGAEYECAGSQADVGSSQNNVATINWNANTKGSNYAVTKLPGTLTVTPRPVTLTAANISKPYDGTPLALTAGDITIALTGGASGGHGVTALPEGESFVFSDFASRTEAGQTPATFSYAAGPGTKLGNYAVTVTPGATITITKSATAISVTAASGSWAYDGEPHSNRTWTATNLSTLQAGDRLEVTFDDASVVTTPQDGANGDGVVPNVITGVRVIRSGAEDVTANYTVEWFPGTLTVTKRPVTVDVKGRTETFTYDGNEKRVEGYEVATEDELYDISADTVFSGTAEATRTDAGTTAMGLVATDFTNNNDCFEVSYAVTDGWVKIEPLDIAAAGDDFAIALGVNPKYNGTVQSIPVESVVCRGLPVTFTRTGENATHAGTYTLTVKANGNFTGERSTTWQVLKRQVTLTSGSATKPYDGSPVRCGDVHIAGDGFIGLEGATFDVRGSQTVAGSSKNAFSYTLKAGTLSGDYDIVKVEGDLTVTKATYPGQEPGGAGIAWSVAPGAATWMYDGRPHGVALTGVPAGVTARLAGHEATDAGDYVATVALDYDAANYEPPAAPAPFAWSIARRPLTLMAASKEKPYDGFPLAVRPGDITASGSGYADGECLDYFGFASITDVGETAATFSYRDSATAKVANYDVTVAGGQTLKVTNACIRAEQVFGADDIAKVYDGVATQVVVTAELLQPARVRYFADGAAATSAALPEEVVWSGEPPSFTHATNATVRFTVEADYYNAYTGWVDVVIAKRTVTLTTPTKAKTYDGAPLTFGADEVELVATSATLPGGDGGHGVTALPNGESFVFSNFASITDAGRVAATVDYVAGTGTRLSDYAVTEAWGTLTVLASADEITVTADSATWAYDGTAHRLPSYTAENADKLQPGDALDVAFAPESVVLTPEDGPDGDGVVSNAIASVRVLRHGTEDVTRNYSLAWYPGVLRVTKARMTFDGAGAVDPSEFSTTATYDGAGHTAAVVPPSLLTGPVTVKYGVSSDAALQATPPAFTNAGVHTVFYTLGAPYYETYAGTATVTVSLRPVTLVSDGAEKVYDGTPLRCDAVRVKDGSLGFVDGEGFAATCSGALTDVGAMENLFDYVLTGGALAGNYTITKEYGWLRVTPARAWIDGDEPGEGAVPAGGLSKFDATFAYDGRPHTIDTNALAAVEKVGCTPTVSYALTQEGPWQAEAFVFTDVVATSFWYRISLNNANYEDYVHAARLTITPRDLALVTVAPIADQDFAGAAVEPVPVVTDGEPSIVTADDYTVSYADNAAPGTATLTLTGRGNYAGTKVVTFVILSAARDVVFDALGGRIGSAVAVTQSMTRVYGDLPTATRAGYVLDGWFLGVTNGALQATAGASLLVDADHTLFAKWTVDPSVSPVVDANGDMIFKWEATGAETAKVVGFKDPNQRIANVVIPDKIEGRFITAIGDGAFANSASGMAALTLPLFCTEIGDRAFYNVRSLTSITFTDVRKWDAPGTSATLSIGSYAFSSCLGLRELTIGESVGRIDDYAFLSCRKLAKIMILGKPSVGRQVFRSAGMDATPHGVEVLIDPALASDTDYMAALKGGISSVTVKDDPIVSSLKTQSVSLEPGRVTMTLSVRKASSWGAVDPASVKVRYWASLSEPAETLSPTAATDNGDGTITVEIAIPEGNSGFLQAVME